MNELNDLLVYLTQFPEYLFLIDAIGAFIHTLFFILLTVLEKHVGIPVKILHKLMVIALVYLAYSISCYIIKPANTAIMMQIITIANGFYAIFSIGLFTFLYKNLKNLGKIYFIGELVVMVLLITLEILVLKNL